jgi:predicted RNase H-like nuclease (RuvC/YqgF family)
MDVAIIGGVVTIIGTIIGLIIKSYLDKEQEKDKQKWEADRELKGWQREEIKELKAELKQLEAEANKLEKQEHDFQVKKLDYQTWIILLLEQLGREAPEQLTEMRNDIVKEQRVRTYLSDDYDNETWAAKWMLDHIDQVMRNGIVSKNASDSDEEE